MHIITQSNRIQRIQPLPWRILHREPALCAHTKFHATHRARALRVEPARSPARAPDARAHRTRKRARDT